jgi:hypothetical protein
MNFETYKRAMELKEKRQEYSWKKNVIRVLGISEDEANRMYNKIRASGGLQVKGLEVL